LEKRRVLRTRRREMGYEETEKAMVTSPAKKQTLTIGVITLSLLKRKRFLDEL
jgi:hypothetical protein